MRSWELEAARHALKRKCAAQMKAVEAARRHLDAAVTHLGLLEDTVAAGEWRRRRVEEHLMAEGERRDAAERRIQEQEKMIRSDEAEVEEINEQSVELRARQRQLRKQKANLESEFGLCLLEKIEDDWQRLREETLPLRCQVDREQMKDPRQGEGDRALRRDENRVRET